MAGGWAGSGCLPRGLTGCRRKPGGGSVSGYWRSWPRRWRLSRRDTRAEFVDSRPPVPALSCVVNSHKNEDVPGAGTAELRARRAALVSRLPQAGGLLPGTLVEQRRRCGKEGCRCTQGELHGPYTYLQVAGRLVYVPAGLAQTVARHVEISAVLRDLLEQISAINLELLARRELD
jgi:hypothetical protein